MAHGGPISRGLVSLELSLGAAQCFDDLGTVPSDILPKILSVHEHGARFYRIDLADQIIRAIEPIHHLAGQRIYVRPIGRSPHELGNPHSHPTLPVLERHYIRYLGTI